MSAWELGQSQHPPQGKGGTQGVGDQPGALHCQMPADLDQSDPLLMLAYDTLWFRFIYQHEHRQTQAYRQHRHTDAGSQTQAQTSTFTQAQAWTRARK